VPLLPRRPRTLRARLIAGLLVLQALACAAVGSATGLELHRFMVSRVADSLQQAGDTYARSLEHSGSGPVSESGSGSGSGSDDGTVAGGPGPGGHPTGGAGAVAGPGEQRARHSAGDTRAQSVGTFGARFLGGKATVAAVVDGDADDATGGSTDDRVALGPADLRHLLALPTDGSPHELRLTSIGDYLVRSQPGLDGDVLVTGLPLSGVDATMHRLEGVEAAVFAAVLAASGIAGAVWVRRSLRPLHRMAAAAGRVAELPLADGEVAVPERAPEGDPRSEVGRLSASFNRMLGHVESALARREASEQRLRRFAADAGHELRTPLAAIRGHAELARRHPDPQPPPVERALERIHAESLRMGAIVDDLLLLTRLDAGRPLEREPVDLTVLAIDATADAQAAGPDHRWELELPEEPVTVTGDRHRLHQLVANLLANARVHTPAGTRVVLALRRLPGGVAAPGGAAGAAPGAVPAGAAAGAAGVELVVTDDGPGVPEELQPEVFARFTRADAGRSRGGTGSGSGSGSTAGGGTGLGLAIARAVATAHGGSLTLVSRPGHTAFRLFLPVAEAVAEAEPRPRPQPEPQPQPQPKKTPNSA